jgi:hypothetical protein
MSPSIRPATTGASRFSTGMATLLIRSSDSEACAAALGAKVRSCAEAGGRGRCFGWLASGRPAGGCGRSAYLVGEAPGELAGELGRDVGHAEHADIGHPVGPQRIF